MKPIQNPILKGPLNELLVTPPDLRAKHYRKHDLINSTISKVAYVAAAAIALATAFIIGSAALGLMAFPSPFIYPALLAVFVIALKAAPHFQAKSSQFHKKYEVENEIAKEYNRLTKAVKTRDDLAKQFTQERILGIGPEDIAHKKSHDFIKEYLAKKPDYLDEGQWLFKLLPLIARHNYFNQAFFKLIFKQAFRTEDEAQKKALNSQEIKVSTFRNMIDSLSQEVYLMIEISCIKKILQNPFCKESSIEDFGQIEIKPIPDKELLRLVKSLDDSKASGKSNFELFRSFFEKTKPVIFVNKTGEKSNLSLIKEELTKIIEELTKSFSD